MATPPASPLPIAREDSGRPSLRPQARGTQAMVATGHPLATLAAVRVLERGGNAVDAGVAAGLALCVVHPDMVNLGGVAPILVYPAATGRVQSVAGLGGWPAAADAGFFRREHGGDIPHGTRCCVVPAAADAWLRTLAAFGTRTLGEVAESAVAYAAEGFPVHEFMALNLAGGAENLARWPSSAEVFLPGGRPPPPGALFRQPTLADTLRRLVAAESKAGGGREAGIEAARREFYEGAIAEAIVDFQRRHDGWMTREDLAAYASPIEDAPAVEFRGHRIHGCGAWSQGPTFLELLALLEGIDLGVLGHNSPAYAHAMAECIKLAFADREAFIGDPAHVPVPLAGLLDPAYAAARRKLVDPDQAWTRLPPEGDPWAHQPGVGVAADGASGGGGGAAFSATAPDADHWDTSYLCVIDRWGNAISATPSDVPFNTPLIPDLGIIVSGRGTQSWTAEGHPACLAPGKRPRLTPNPALATREGRLALVFGTPGGDMQPQSMAQFLCNVLVFGMPLQEAVEQPRLGAFNFPSSFAPHVPTWGTVRAEGRLDPAVGDYLAERGNRIEAWADWSWKAGALCAAAIDPETGIRIGAADLRREADVVGW